MAPGTEGVHRGCIPYDDLPDGLVVTDGGLRVVAVNSQAERILKTSADELIGKHLEDAIPLCGLDGRAWWACATPLRSLTTVTGHPERNLLLGSTEVLVTSRYLRDKPRGSVVRVVVTLRETRHRAREERSRAELISTVAHELRSPLTSVKGFTATLLAKWDRFTDEQKRLMLETVNADADRVTRLISELLDIARIDSGRLTIRRQVVDLPRMIERRIAGMVAAGHPREKFQVEVAPGIPEMWLDSDKLEQIMANLLENAVHHGDGTVTISLRPEGDGAAVTVMDKGEGIPAEARERVFTRFWRSGRRGGTGLGLYIVRGLIEAHGGEVEVGEAPGGGALFRFVLPAGTPEFITG